MPLAMSQVLQAHILIFKTDIDHPLYVTPDLDTQEKTIFLLYHPSGPGHYDSLIPFAVSSTSSFVNKTTKCSCGVNKKGTTSETSCTPQPRYTTRCMCYKLGQACTALCHCKNCGNPNGQRKVGAEGNIRKRRTHALQTSTPKSKKLPLIVESLSSAIWSDFELIVLSEILCAVPNSLILPPPHLICAYYYTINCSLSSFVDHHSGNNLLEFLCVANCATHMSN